jgi:hypothetical protein
LQAPDRSTLDLADADAARGSLLDAGFASVAMADIAFDVDFEREAGLRSFFVPRSRPMGPWAWASSSAAISRSGRDDR